MRLKHFLSVFLTLLTLSGQVWGAKITDYTNIVSGQVYYIGATTGGTDYYWSANGGITEGTGKSGVAVTSSSSATPVTFTGSGTSWTITFSNGKYLKLNSSDANGKYDVSGTSSTWTLSNASSLIKMTNSSHVFQKNNTSTAFASYKTTSAQTNIWLEAVASTEKYTVSFVTGTGNPSQANIKETTAGGGVLLPNIIPACSEDGWELYGWATATYGSSSTTTAPTTTLVGLVGETYYPSSDETLYAVYRKNISLTNTTTTYTLNGNWTSDDGNWTKTAGSNLSSSLASGKYGLNSGSSTATSPVSYSEISKIVFTGSKSGSGSGTVEFFYGNGNTWTTLGSKAVANSQTWTISPTVSGQLKVVFTRTAGNVYIASIAVTYKTRTDYYWSNPTCTPACDEPDAPENGSFS